MELSVIIVNWNAAADTLRCLQQIGSWRYLQPTVWVVDNGSTDNSVEFISGEYPTAHLIQNSTNLGYAGGNNRGLIDVLACSDAPILLLNNDATISEEAVSRLMGTLQTNPNFGFVGPLLYDAEHKEKLLAAGGQNIIRHLTSHIPKVPAGEPVQLVDYVPGTVMLGQAEVFHTVGLLDEEYFFSGEMPDICHRARQHGYLSAIDTRARAFHALGRSSHLRETLHTYYIIRNRFLYMRKFYARPRRLTPYTLWTLYSLALTLKLYLGGKPHTGRAVGLGLVDGLIGRFGGQNERVLTLTMPANLNNVHQAGFSQL